MILQPLSYIALALLAVGFVVDLRFNPPTCTCGCGNPWHQHSPLRRHQ